LDETLVDAHGDAIIAAARKTGLDPATFPETCPWPFDRLMDPAFLPEAMA